MSSWKRLIGYLLLNIAVSAITVWLVMFLWDQSRGPLPAATPVLTVDPAAGTPAVVIDTPVVILQPTPTLQQARVHIVQFGDTLGSIAIEYDVTIEELISFNALANGDSISIGQQIFIPVGGSPAGNTEPQPTPLPPAPADTISIVSVVGAGDLESERVVLKCVGADPVSLLNWQLRTPRNQVFSFPQLTLYPEGSVSLYSGGGVNTVVDLYWGLGAPAWQSGDAVGLYDPQGNLHASYQVP